MIEIPKQYEIGKKIPIKDFVPASLDSETRKKIRDVVIKVILTYQISGEEILSVRNEMYDYRIIQFYDFEVKDIKKAAFISEIYQELIKSPCIIRIFDKTKEVYSFGLKRLNQNDKNEIVLEEKFISDSFDKRLPSSEKKNLEKAISFENVINKTNKVNFYFEIYAKSFILKNQKLYMKSKGILESTIWYDEKKMKEIYILFKDIVRLREKMGRLNLPSERVKYNQELKRGVEKIDKCLPK
ncbi:DUF4391 domain-containing protein [uncultured Fusobacterium sp.]|uniref:DUF4391 domain-containing protein n=1 Tax=uncultured Fusobacterium sp. TaxID=159267 RepID=UPI0028044C50|nr:DUF4391 domain-containing protein [uncultured Fusobacterium sp.]